MRLGLGSGLRLKLQSELVLVVTSRWAVVCVKVQTPA